MPFLRIISNAALKDENPELCAERAADLLSLKLGKSVANIVVQVNTDEKMSFGGSYKTKGILAYLDAIGFNDKAGVVKILTDFLVEKFEDVEPSSVSIVLTDMSAANVAKDGRLFG